MSAGNTVEGVVTLLSAQQYWRHGYRLGWDDRQAGRRNLLDDYDREPGSNGAVVLPMRSDDPTTH